MPNKQPFKRHRFPAAIILCAVQMYLRFPLSYQVVANLLAERGVDVDRSAVFRWVQKFGPELSKRTEKHRCRASLNWHVLSRQTALQLPAEQRLAHIFG